MNGPNDPQPRWKITDVDVPFSRALRWCLTIGTAHFLTVVILAPALVGFGLLVMAGIGTLIGPKDTKEHFSFFPKLASSTPQPAAHMPPKEYTAPGIETFTSKNPVQPPDPRTTALFAKGFKNLNRMMSAGGGQFESSAFAQKDGITYELDPETLEPLWVAETTLETLPDGKQYRVPHPSKRPHPPR